MNLNILRIHKFLYQYTSQYVKMALHGVLGVNFSGGLRWSVHVAEILNTLKKSIID